MGMGRLVSLLKVSGGAWMEIRGRIGRCLVEERDLCYSCWLGGRWMPIRIWSVEM